MDRARAVILGLAGILLVLSALLVLPFLDFFLLAILIAYPLRPVYIRLRPHLGPRIAAGTLVVAATGIILLPSVFVVRTMARKLISFLRRIRRGEITFTEFEDWLFETTGVEVDLVGRANEILRDVEVGVIDSAVSSFGVVTHVLIGLALTAFLLYYFLKDGGRFAVWLRETSPLPPHIQAELNKEFDDVMWAMLASHVLIAVIQGVVAGIGLFAVGIPDALFWTLVMVFLAVMPIIGSFLVWGPATLYLATIGRPVAGTLLFIYGIIVVSLTDDFLRPIIIDRYTDKHLNPGVVILGILGGVYLLGFLGIFFGPVIIASLRSVLDVYRREFVDPEETDPDVGSQSADNADDTTSSPSP